MNRFKLSGYVDVPQKDNDKLLVALNIEPVSVCVDVSGDAWRLYKSGYVTQCGGTNLNHGVLIVGAGHNNDQNLNFWKIKNSWTTTWGEKGYIRIQRDTGKSSG